MIERIIQTFDLREMCETHERYEYWEFMASVTMLEDDADLRRRAIDLLKKDIAPELKLLGGAVMDNQLYFNIEAKGNELIGLFRALFYVCDLPKGYDGTIYPFTCN